MIVALRMLTVLAVVLLGSSTVFAQSAAPNTGTAIGMGLSVLGAGLGIGLVGFSALSSIARQPEQSGTIRGSMLLLAFLVEGAAIISLVLCYISK